MNTRTSKRSNSRNISSTGHEQEIWRDKYFSTLDELENEQTSANATIDVLRRGLLSVSLAGDGLDGDLDQKLIKLRGQLKTAQDYSELSQLLQNIETDLIQLDTQKLESSKKQKTHTAEALSLLLKSSLDSEIKQELKDFQKKLKSSEKNSDLSRSFETDLITLLLPLLTELSKEYVDKNPSGGLWGRFRQSVSSAQVDSDVEAAADIKVEGSPASQIEAPASRKNTTTSSAMQNSEATLVTETKQFIGKLIAKVYGHTALTQVAKGLSKEVSVADAAALLASYPKVINLLDLSQSQDKKAFLDYLGEINYSLAKVSNSISKTQKAQRKIQSRDKIQSQKFRGGIDKIRNILNTATDLENLKTQTQEQLDDIVQSLDESSSIAEKSEQELTDLASKQTAELAAAVAKTKRISEAFDLSPSPNTDPDVDPLTKLKNQGALLKELKTKLAIHKNRQQRLCLCIGDVQSLQALNDEYGRNAGDKALELLAQEIASKSKESDFLAYGGNGRFILLKPVTAFATANAEVGSLSSELAKLPFRFKGNEVTVTLSFAVEQSTLSDSASSLLEKVELALEKTKASPDLSKYSDSSPSKT